MADRIGMARLEYNPLSHELDMTGDGGDTYGIAWDDGHDSGESYAQMMERRVAALEEAVALLLSKQ